MKSDNKIAYHYEINQPTRQELFPYINRCIHFSSSNGDSLQKSLWPEPNISLIFNFTRTKLNKKICPDIVVFGLHETLYSMQPGGNDIDVMILHFAGIGFSIFSEKNASILTDRMVDAKDVFGEAITILFNKMKSTKDIKERQEMLDDFFLLLLKKSKLSFPCLGELVNNIQADPEFTIPKEITISYRHLSRIFKQKVGANIKTFRRLCRFEIAKQLIIKSEGNSLTDIGYQATYYDQAHFGREFKKLSGLRAKYFEPLCNI